MRVGLLNSGAALALVAAAMVTSSAVFADVYVPEGSTGTALRLNQDLQPDGRISGLGNVHGMTAAPNRGLLISASLKQQPRSSLKGLVGVSAAEFAKQSGPPAQKVSLISLISLKTGKVIRQIEAPGMVHHVTIGANERYVLATHPKMGSVSVIDLDSDKVSATIKTGPMPNYAVYDPKTKSFFVSNAGNSTISQIDPAKGVVVNTYKTPGGAEHLAIDVAGRRLFAAEADAGVVSVMNLDTGAIEASFDIGGELHGIAYDPARDAVYVSARGKGAIAWINLKTGALSLEKIGPQPYHMALEGNRILVSSAKDDVVWVVDVKTHDLLKTIPIAGCGHQMAIVPDS